LLAANQRKTKIIYGVKNKMFTTTKKTANGKIQLCNENGVSRFWKQTDTDTIESPTKKHLNFYIMGRQNLESLDWVFVVYDIEGKQMGTPLNTDGINTPRLAELWYKKQR
jgi:hypothetical protein